MPFPAARPPLPLPLLRKLLPFFQKTRKDRKNKTRMIVIITSAEVMAHDTLTGETILIKRDALSKHADFFLPISGREKDSVTQEERLDNRIAERVMRLYNLLGLSNAGVGGQYILDFLLSLIVVFHHKNNSPILC